MVAHWASLHHYAILLGFHNGVCLFDLKLKNKNQESLKKKASSISWEISSGHTEPIFYPGDNWMELSHGETLSRAQALQYATVSLTLRTGVSHRYWLYFYCCFPYK